MKIRPVKTKRIYEEIIEQIHMLVTEGKIKAGDRLPSERDLAEMLQVSRASVREALSALEMMGLLEIRSGEGTYIKQVNIDSVVAPLAWVLSLEKDTLSELLETRKMLETQAAFLAALRAEPKDLAEMQESLQEIRQAMQHGRKDYPCDRSFHEAIASGAKNRILYRMLDAISNTMHQTLKTYWSALFEKKGIPELLYQEHEAIYKAIEAKQPQEAYDRMLKHLERIDQEFYKEYDKESE